ncbi:hypothetical protein P5673_014747 [Acropora cervicornis]|uniref:Uncharacterized protein n=1 Tax=Acropora cervicornis TaxID=6130 RepID=A0AAD9V5H5_ACRCE|nr:hypothetical protein P5673_014747 [Acropora cervicornis]
MTVSVYESNRIGNEVIFPLFGALLNYPCKIKVGIPGGIGGIPDGIGGIPDGMGGIPGGMGGIPGINCNSTYPCKDDVID